ncbi:MAG: hypothetical protein ACM3MD_09770 [Betaproteobacteria bacterium]
MKKELAEQFNQEVDGYRNALLYCARKCDWESFKAKAGKLFDYVESIEYSEIERRFFTVFTSILVVLCLAIIALFGVDFEANPELQRLKQSFVAAAIAGSSFEIYFFLDFRMYMDFKTSFYKKRREKFIRNMEQDFRGHAMQTGRNAAAS